MNRRPFLTQRQRDSYQYIITAGEAALARLSVGNPMRGVIARNVADARHHMEGASNVD